MLYDIYDNLKSNSFTIMIIYKILKIQLVLQIHFYEYNCNFGINTIVLLKLQIWDQ